MNWTRWPDWLIGARYAPVRSIILLVVGGACLLTAMLLRQQTTDQAGHTPIPLQNPLANRNERGVNLDAQRYTPEDLTRELARIQAAGFRWVRQRFGWEEIEPQRGVLDWSRWDAIVEGCAQHELNLLVVLDGSPAWARPDPANHSPFTPPQQVADWGAFVHALATRYRGRIGAYQMWDEPNLAEHWGGHYVDPVAYMAILREGALQVRQADPGVPVLLAALAPTVENGPLNLNEVEFLRQLVQAGGAPFFDIVAVQPYGFGDPPEAPPRADRLNWARTTLVRRELVRLGLTEMPVWATAGGWNVFAGDPFNPWPVVSVQQQIDYTLAALQQAHRDWPWLGVTFLYTWQPALPTDNPRWGFALTAPDGHATSLLAAVSADNKKKYPLSTGVYVANAQIADYTGDWRFSDAGADPPHGATAAARNARIAFDMFGTALDLHVRRGNFWGFFYVLVDGHPANGLPHDENGQAYLILYDPQGSVESVTVARGLPAGAHHVEIVAHGGWGQWPLIGWTVRSEPKSLPTAGGSAGLLFVLGVLAWIGVPVQFLLAPHAMRPLFALLERTFRFYRALPEWLPILLTLSTALACYIVPWTALAVPLLGLLGVLIFLRIDLGLATVALSLPFYIRPKLLFGRPFSVVELTLGLCLVAWLLARLLDWGRVLVQYGLSTVLARRLATLNEWPLHLLRWKSNWRRHALDLGMMALVGVAWLAVGLAEYRTVAVREFRVLFLESALFYALIRLAIKSERARRRLVEGWLLGAVIIAGIGLLQWATGQNLITADGVSRVRGFYGSPNNLALYLGRALPMLLATLWVEPNRPRRIVYGLAALPVLGALLLTFSKGALLLGLPASVLVLGLLQRRRARWATVAALVVLALLLLPMAFTDRFRGWFTPGSGTAFFRLELWRATWNMIAAHPLWGVGPDNFLYHYRTRYVLPSAWGELNLSHPHNLLLDTWTRLGLPGVMVVGWLIGWFIHTLWGQVRVLGDNRTFVLGSAGAMAALLAHGMVDQAIFLVDLGFVFALLLALVQKQT